MAHFVGQAGIGICSVETASKMRKLRSGGTIQSVNAIATRVRIALPIEEKRLVRNQPSKPRVEVGGGSSTAGSRRRRRCRRCSRLPLHQGDALVEPVHEGEMIEADASGRPAIVMAMHSTRLVGDVQHAARKDLNEVRIADGDRERVNS